jgi:RsiW-degrading membrane proteinase PrsW (M82 family)
MGYFLALSILETKKRTRLLFRGIILASLLHGLYNFSIIEIGGNLGFIIPIIILLGSAAFLTCGFKRLKKLKSVCKLH